MVKDYCLWNFSPYVHFWRVISIRSELFNRTLYGLRIGLLCGWRKILILKKKVYCRGSRHKRICWSVQTVKCVSWQQKINKTKLWKNGRFHFQFATFDILLTSGFIPKIRQWWRKTNSVNENRGFGCSSIHF